MLDQPIKVALDNNLHRLAFQVGVATLSRILLNTARRFAYPFAPALSRGLGIPLTKVTSLIAVNQATGILGILFGPLADHFGYRLMMLVGIGMMAIGMFSGGLLPFYSVVLVALFLAGLGKTVFDPALQAYVGEQVPFQRRGTAIGLLEFSWAGSTLVGIPLIALLIKQLDWRIPFFALGGLGLLCVAALAIAIPHDGRNPNTRHASIGVWKAWQQLLREKTALGALGFAFFFSAANDNLFVVYGAWLETSFGLSIVGVGMGTSVIGIAELLGEISTASLSDRLGLKRSVIIGLALSAISYGVLPFSGQTLTSSLISLFILFFVFEFTIVSFLSLCTELTPGSRATMMSGFFAAAGIGRVVGAVTGAPVWLAGGIPATGLVSAGITTVALILLIWGLRGWR